MKFRGLAVAGLVLVLAAAFSCGGGDDGSRISQGDFDSAAADTRAMVEAARNGDVDAAIDDFGRMHNFTHIVDSELRKAGADAQLVRDLFDAVVAIETNVAASQPDANALVAQGETLLDLLNEAAQALGYEAPD